MRALLTRIRRWLDLEAPEDGLCTWTHEVVVRFQNYEGVRESRDVYRCRYPWHHKGGHFAPEHESLRS